MLPIDIQLGKKRENLSVALNMMNRIDKDTDMVVLPEMFNTGFSSDMTLMHSLAEPNDGQTITELREWAGQNRIAVWGGFTAVDRDAYFNRGFMIDDIGQVRFYDKRHLFRFGGESDMLTAGVKESPIITYRTWNLKMAICYDIRFPIWNRNTANNYDALIVPANWAHARVYAWKHLLIARAIENQSYVLGCNREGSDIYGEYPSGDSFAFDNWGKNVAQRRQDGTIYVTLNANMLNSDRKKFDPWRDADTFRIIT